MANYEIITLPAGENIWNAIEEIVLSQMVHINLIVALFNMDSHKIKKVYVP